MAGTLPANAHVSTHPCVRAKMSLLRSKATNARDTKLLVHEIATLVGCEALAKGLDVRPGPTMESPIGYEYTAEVLSPTKISIMPILRSGLGMVGAIESILPEPVPVHHLGLFRDKATMSAVEYYNNLHNHEANGPSELVILVDPIIATGATACAAIETLRDWGVKRIIMISILCSKPGLERAATEWPEGVEVWSGAMDEGVDDKAMIKPGLGDVGDRLFLTLGK